MRLDVITIFPDYVAPLDLSLIGSARRKGLVDLRVHDLRDVTTDRHRTVDDSPLGGGAGMVMRPEVWAAALERVLADGDRAISRSDAADPPQGADEDRPEPRGRPIVVVPSPSGERFTQAHAAELAAADRLVFVCGRYEGIDERVYDHIRDRDLDLRLLSLGDYVLNGGEVAVLAMTEAIVRLVPGVIGNPESLVEESHADGLLEYPVYTRPATWDDAGRIRSAPDVLLSGHHGRIARWRRDRQLERTAERRPDMIEALEPTALSSRDREILDTPREVDRTE